MKIFNFIQNKKNWAIYYLWSTQILIFIGIGAAEHDLLARFGAMEMDRKCLQARHALMCPIIYGFCPPQAEIFGVVRAESPSPGVGRGIPPDLSGALSQIL